MSQKSITIPMPDELYERVQEIAEASDRSIEEVLLETLGEVFQSDADLPPLEALSAYSVERLWAIVQRRLSWSQSLRLHELSAKHKDGMISSVEVNELNELLEFVDIQMLLRSEALLLLKQRGQNIDSYLKLGA
ncbi:MAG: hypothetical protein ABI835_07235 [Chloroflexota bacterium]